MSTKCTLAYGYNFHLYNEVCDDDHVYLELHTTHFEAGYGRVMIPIPMHIWETIRHLGSAQLDLVAIEEENLRAMVEDTIDQRIAEYQRVLRENPDRAGLIRLLGCLLYGTADSPRHEQVRSGLEYFRRKQQRQREVRSRIIDLQRIRANPANTPERIHSRPGALAETQGSGGDA